MVVISVSPLSYLVADNEKSLSQYLLKVILIKVNRTKGIDVRVSLCDNTG